jgi:GntR family transcriptional regulator, rspAB operon transcriptional repressor
MPIETVDPANEITFKKIFDGNKINVYKTLKNAIQFLKLKPGSSITEAELKRILEVSRTPIREALIRLSGDLLIDIFPQSGTYISKIDLHLAKEMAYMRHILETEILLDLCKMKKDLSTCVSESLFFMKQAISKQDVIAYIKTDNMYHQAIFNYAGHEIIWNMISNSRMHYIRFLMLDMAFPDSMQKSFKQHNGIVKCIKEGDSEGLRTILDVHHDHNSMERKDLIIQKYSEYIK